MASSKAFKAALIVVDFQEDFCPPNGSLAVANGRAIAPAINALLSLPFALKIATKDWHPADHVSFAANHAGAAPYTSSHTIVHPSDPARSYSTTLWPIHCVQDTPGADLVPELDVDALDEVIEKGLDPSVEMYSAFYDPFHVSDSGLSRTLKDAGVTDVFVVGLASDFCVKATAEHAVEEGYRTFIVTEGTRPVLPDKWDDCKSDMEAKGINFTSIEGDEVAQIKSSS
ncbi:Isochorismatase-like protein [Dactylonectria estremocensis]|uniref:nicotinamidase n=1 Tax=Dactylonectria estremocensis TaxID=1079267 RepID=A0A9P9DNJ4_9HYPO|nr:Isochorismatase-like protein [Dactylonectria estremocensis]